MATFNGALHLHSTYSYDGKLSLPALKVFLRERGVSFACMSEHTDELTLEAAANFVAECRALSDESFVFVPGFEVPYQNAHLLMFGCDTFFGQRADHAPDVQLWVAAATFCVLAHPVKNHFKLDEGILNQLHAIEIWNQQYDGKLMPCFRSLTLVEKERSERPLMVTGGLDFHREEHFGSPLTTLELEILSEQGILQALKAGRYTFGSPQRTVSAWEAWEPTYGERAVGIASRFVITLGKHVNALLAALHLPRPRFLAKLIRRWL